MSSTLTAIALNANIQANISPNVATLSGNLFAADQSNVTVTAGSAVGSADGVYTSNVNIVSGTPLVINLEALLDPFGNTLTVGHVVGIKISNVSGTGSLSHGGGTNPVYAAQSLTVTPGDFFAQSFNGAGLTVTSGSLQNLQVTASTGTVGAKITILTRSA
jgi:hypothetical protein